MKSKLWGDRKYPSHRKPQFRTGGEMPRLNISEPTGTLVVWSTLDRVRWTGGAKTLERTAELCGRIYRKFLTDSENQVRINLLRVSDEDGHLTVEDRQDCFPNDPLYLMTPSSTPEPFRIQPMFELFNERNVAGADW